MSSPSGTVISGRKPTVIRPTSEAHTTRKPEVIAILRFNHRGVDVSHQNWTLHSGPFASET
jgi:hypothetical protein